MATDELGPRLAEIARDVQSQADVSHAADRIAESANELLSNALGAGITLARRRHSLYTAAATHEVVREGDRLQYELKEGPCVDAAWKEYQVYAGDLPVDERWPTWGPMVAERFGVRSMLCTQLFTHEDKLGALNVYATRRYAFGPEDRDTASLLAAHAAVAVAAAQEVENLKVAVDRRTVIGKALGITMVRYGLDDDHALAVLQRLSSHQNRKLYDIALDVIEELGPPSSQRGKQLG